MRGSGSLQFYFFFLISYLHRFLELCSHIFALCKWNRVTQHARVLTLNNYVRYPSRSTRQAHIPLISSWITRSHTNLYSLGSEEDFSYTRRPALPVCHLNQLPQPSAYSWSEALCRDIQSSPLMVEVPSSQPGIPPPPGQMFPVLRRWQTPASWVGSAYHLPYAFLKGSIDPTFPHSLIIRGHPVHCLRGSSPEDPLLPHTNHGEHPPIEHPPIFQQLGLTPLVSPCSAPHCAEGWRVEEWLWV